MAKIFINEIRFEIIKGLNTRQRNILRFLTDCEYAKRKEVLDYLFSLGDFYFQTGDKTRRLQNKTADRFMRAEISDMVIKGVPICTTADDGYCLATDIKEIDRARAELLAKANSLRLRADGLPLAYARWNAEPVRKTKPAIKNLSVAEINQLNLFVQQPQVVRCLADITKGRG